jgi:hypothetical protein
MSQDRALAIALRLHELADAYVAVELRYNQLLRATLEEADRVQAGKKAIKLMREVGEEYLAFGSKMIRTANFVEPILDEIEKESR